MTGSKMSTSLQCCLICGRTLTDRALHDELEEAVLATIRAEHPQWVDAGGACEPCAKHYRELLKARLTHVNKIGVSRRGRYQQWLAGLVKKLLPRAARHDIGQEAASK